MLRSLRFWYWLPVTLLLSACGGVQNGTVVPAAPQYGGSSVDVASNPPAIVEIPGVPTIPSQIASDLAGNEWIAGFGPSMLVRINEQTHAMTQYALPNQNSNPYAIALGPNHTGMWFTELASNTIGFIKLSNHSIHRYNIPTSNAGPYGITAGPDNAMWFTEMGTGKIGRISVFSHAITEYTLPSGSQPFQITTGPDGALWFTDYAGKGIGRLTTSLHFSAFAFSKKYFLVGITSASDGGIWYTGSSPDFAELVGRIDPSTHLKQVWLHDRGGTRVPRFIVNRGSDLWFTEQADAKIGRFSMSAHTLSRYALPSGYTIPLGIALGSDNQLWFTEQDTSPQSPALGKLCPNLSHAQCAGSLD
jgi:virginiamycin B lyase